jgi:GNAT superfamily N-acetyltransferase
LKASTDVTLREATEADLPVIVRLLAQLRPDDPTVEDASAPLPAAYAAAFRRMLAAGQRVLIAVSDDAVVATATLIVCPNLSHGGRPYAIVENVVVDESRRGAGLGELLLRRAIDLAREAGCYKLSLTSNRARTDAHRFYGRIGLRATHEGFWIDLGD